MSDTETTVKTTMTPVKCRECGNNSFLVNLAVHSTAALILKCNSVDCGKVALRYELDSIAPKVYR